MLSNELLAAFTLSGIFTILFELGRIENEYLKKQRDEGKIDPDHEIFGKKSDDTK